MTLFNFVTMMWLQLSVILLYNSILAIANHDLINFHNNACSDYSSYPFWFLNSLCTVNPNVLASPPECIMHNGYKMESHTATTKDGYILTLFRIPPKETDCRKNKQPVLLQHGISTDSSTFVNVGNRSLAFSLADAGYDVWLGNTRGNPYSYAHVSLEPSDPRFWDFSIDDIQEYDTLAFITTVAQITGKGGDMIFVGHSLGTTLILMFASSHPEVANTLLRGIVTLSPCVYFDLRLPYTVIVKFAPIISEVARILGINAFFYNQDFLVGVEQYGCTFFPYVCKTLTNLAFGESQQMLPDDLLNFYASFPRVTPVKVLLQFVQLMNSHKVEKYDYGTEKNLKVYGQERPPLYDLGNIKVPVLLFFGLKENLISLKSVDKTFRELGSMVKNYYSVPIGNNNTEDQFNHIGYMTSRYVHKFFTKDFLRLLRTKFAPKTSC